MQHKNKLQEGEATFIMPHYSKEMEWTKKNVSASVQAIINQTDQNWHLVIIDDYSPCQEAVDFLDHVKQMYFDKITVIKNGENMGPGVSRNIGIAFAHEQRLSPFILFNDCDDISHPERLAVTRKSFILHPDASVIYSSFIPVDEYGVLYHYHELHYMIQEILDSHKNPPEGHNAWIKIGTETGYCNLTSSTSVLTEVALLYPFPNFYVSEDTHAWYQYSAGGNSFYYLEEIPSRYCIPRGKVSMTTTSYDTFETFFREMAENDEKGFISAMEIAIEKGKISPFHRKSLLLRFKLKSAETIYKCSCKSVAKEIVKSAMEISKPVTLQLIFDRFHDTLGEFVGIVPDLRKAA